MVHRVMIDDVYISGVSCRALLDVPEKRGHDYFIEGVVQIEIVVFVVSVIQSCIALKDSYCPSYVNYAGSQSCSAQS